jgi:hypothetical protein
MDIIKRNKQDDAPRSTRYSNYKGWCEWLGKDRGKFLVCC